MLQAIQNAAATSEAKDHLPVWHQVASAEKSEFFPYIRRTTNLTSVTK